MDISLIEIVLAATIGGIVLSYFGWAGSIPRERFDWYKFSISIGSAFIAGILYALILFDPSGNFTKEILKAIMAGITGDVGTNRVVGAIQASAINKIPSVIPPIPISPAPRIPPPPIPPADIDPAASIKT